ncbi:hypothetical protein LTR05_000392 [Lithohypha guttulata]|uniref:CNH domain-containing protein n=1 Tax=Lithohypha guttulata TaxID=1690604 RepID=A0AAN7Y9B1_9EURO|nr:hypothetical protein LTR05_000392 [Lithohypha guttulata]
MSDEPVRKRRRLQVPEAGPFVLKKVLDDIPLNADGPNEEVSITCVEFWNDNLYIGTSASEILHLVCLPAQVENDQPQYILASRLQPSGHDADSGSQPPGVQQILVLPGPLKACVLCNGTASFYSLPELSPAFPNREPTGVQWIGGFDENLGADDPDGTSIMIATTRRILQVRVGDKLKPIRPNIEYPECHEAARRDTIACVANATSYALLEIEHQQKIPLFDISTAPILDAPQDNHLVVPPITAQAHTRSRSLSDFPSPATASGSSAPADRAISPVHTTETTSRSGSRPRSSTAETSPTPPARQQRSVRPLKPHVISAFTNEFMLTTGTTPFEPGVGMFVNLDGDVSRGTVEFDYYPQAVMSCTFQDKDQSTIDLDENQFIVALIDRPHSEKLEYGLQIQQLDSNNDNATSKVWLRLAYSDHDLQIGKAGLHRSVSVQRHAFQEVADLLQAVRYQPINQSSSEQHPDPIANALKGTAQERGVSKIDANGRVDPTTEYVAKRAAEELKFVQRLGHTVTQAMTWCGENLYQVLPNPLLLQLESQMLSAIKVDDKGYHLEQVNVPQILSFLGSVRNREAQNETEFLSIKYARQKASMILFVHLLTGLKNNANLKAASKLAENALLESELDPRVPLSLLNPLSYEVLYGSTGVWIQQGLIDCLEGFESPMVNPEDSPAEFWMMIRHFLSTWQEKRGASGSISDEKAIFDSVDAALLRLLLYQDSVSRTDGVQTATRVKLNNVVDHWKGDFDRAVILLEHHKRLFLLSRLYQSRKSSRDVLHTWKRICDGEDNLDDDVAPEHVYLQMRKYLPLLRDTSLVKEFSVWLAQRSPELAVQVLSDDNGRVKFAPAEVVSLLKEYAPGAVQLFLEHLVFTKNLDQYADDLVGYYLDSVLSVLEHSDQARQSLAESYTTYRALTSPKPTYLNFIQENAPEEPWWQSRLRLLQLLGTGGYAAATGTSKTLTYSIDMVLERLKPFSTYLVSESIILDARQGRHNEALKLLVHGLGDYDTAVRYCYFGGPSSPSTTIDTSMLPSWTQQEQHFQVLFDEFLRIEDEEERLDRTSHLLGTFATWFDPLTVLESIPETWSISLLGEFLLRTFRNAVTERNQAIIVKALSAAQNLQKQAEFIDLCEKMGSKLELDSSTTSRPSDDIEVNTAPT